MGQGSGPAHRLTKAERLVSKSDFDSRDWNSKWGAHDHVVLGRMLRELRSASQPWLATVLTLSSHEPFEVPMATVIRGNDVEHQFLNSHVYADRSVAAFIERAKREAWWDSTLVIITADHGHHYPETPQMFEQAPEQYRWSRDFLALDGPSFAYYAFNNGFGFVDSTGSFSFVFDNISKRVTHQEGRVTPAAILAGRSFQQATAQAYIELGRPRAA